jgi:hypothetical protein
LTRTLVQDVAKLTALNPVTGKTDWLSAMLADRAQLRIMHMVTASPARTPSFMMFGDPAYVYRMAGSRADCAMPPACVAVDPDINWLGGDLQGVSDGSWFAMAGPGVAKQGEIALRSQPADVRPTMLALLGLADSYVHDGIALPDVLAPSVRSQQLLSSAADYVALARAYDDINDPLGPLSRASLALSTRAAKGGDTAYRQYLDAIDAIITRRDALARDMKASLDNVAFGHSALDVSSSNALIDGAQRLLREVDELAGRSMGPIDRPWKAAADAQ